jgi:Icc protein
MIKQWIFRTALVAAFCLPADAQMQGQPFGRPTRIALVSDTHTTRGTNDEQSRYRARLEKVMAAVNEAKVDLVLIAGDLTQEGKPEELADFKQQIGGFAAPVWFVPGNHDIGNKLIQGKGNETGLTPFRVGRFEMRMGPSFFVRTRAGVRVIGLNSPIFGSRFPREDSMWRFLEKELRKPSRLPTVVFMHYPPFTKKPEEPSEYWNIEPEPRQRLLKLLRQGGVRTVLTGHLHRPLTNRSGDILFVTTGPVSFGLPAGKQPQGWTLVSVPVQGEAQAEFRPIKD